MPAWYQKFAAMPLLKRMLFGLPLVGICFWIALKLTVVAWVDQAVEAIADENQVEYDSTFFRFNGDFGMNGFKLVHMFPDGSEGPTYLADRLVIHTPGFFWLWKGAFGDPEQVPDLLGLTAENFRESTRTDATPGNFTNLPYDAVGCGVKLLTPANLGEMGLPSARNASLSLQRLDEAKSRLQYEVLTPGVGQLQMNFTITMPRPLAWSNIIVAMFAAQATDISMSMKDLGFVKMRNEFCARKAGVPTVAFLDFHMRGLAQRLAEGGDQVNPGTLASYREFARDGGSLTLASVNARPVNLADFVALGRLEKMNSMPITIRHDDSAPVTFSYESGVANVTAALPAASATVAAPAAASIAATMPEGDIEYSKLKSMIGAHVEFSTLNGLRRRGTLVSYSPYMSVLKLDVAEGGFILSVPADSITQVLSLPSADLLVAAHSERVNAKTN